MTSDDAELASRLGAVTRFARLVHVRECASTQDLAAAERGGPPTIYWADHQSAGRGRQAHVWHDEPGTDLAVTFRFTQQLPLPMALPATVPLCVLQAIAPLQPGELRLKWPNDVLLGGRKLAGVLIDAAGHGHYAIGIGLNVNRVRFPPELEALATSLALATGRTHDRGELLLALAQRLETALQALADGAVAPIAREFAARLGLLDRRVVVTAGAVHEGVLRELDFERLVLDDGRTVPLGLVQSLRAR